MRGGTRGVGARSFLSGIPLTPPSTRLQVRCALATDLGNVIGSVYRGQMLLRLSQPRAGRQQRMSGGFMAHALGSMARGSSVGNRTRGAQPPLGTLLPPLVLIVSPPHLPSLGFQIYGLGLLRFSVQRSGIRVYGSGCRA